MNFLQYPFTVFPSPYFFELPEINFRVKISSKVFAMTAGIYIQNVNGVNGIEVFFLRQSTPGIYHARVKTDT